MTSRLLSSLHELLAARALRFLAVGVVNSAVGYVLYLVGLIAGAAPSVALVLATVMGALFNYFSTGRLVFQNLGMDRLPHFLLAYFLVYVLNLALLQALISIGLSAGLAQLLLLPEVALASYLLFKHWVFRRREPQ